MKIARLDLIAALQIAAPALAVKDLVVELSHFWFSGSTLLAYNDVIGIEAPLVLDLVGGLRGALLLGLLENSKAKDVNVEFGEDGVAKVTAGGAKFKLALLDYKRAVWQFPRLGASPTDLLSGFLPAIEKVLPTVGVDTSVPDQLGVTVVSDEQWMDFYTTDSKTVTWSSLSLTQGSNFPSRFVLPTTFCEQLLRLCKDGGEMAVTTNDVVAQSKSGVRLYTRLVDVPRPVDFDAAISGLLKEGYRKLAAEIPLRLELALERALIMLQGLPNEAIEFKVGDGVLELYAKTPNGEIKDTMSLEHAFEPCTVRIDPALVKRALSNSKTFFLMPKCAVMLGDGGYVHLIAPHAK